jgi:hypothetical protein
MICPYLCNVNNLIDGLFKFYEKDKKTIEDF